MPLPPSESFMEESIMRGRNPAGPEVVEHLEGSPKAKERLRVILETLMGQWRVSEACQRLGICEQRFRQLRAELLQAALDSLEDQPPGRPRRPKEPEETAALRQQLEALERELQVAQVREEIVLALPRVAVSPAEGSAPPKKRRPRQKHPQPTARRRRR
jgi:transposase-like protein